MSELKVIISSDGYAEVPVGNDGRRKRISIKDFSKAISTLVSESDQNLTQDTLILPKSIYTLAKTAAGYIVTMFYKGETREMTHTSAGTHMIPLPNVIIRLNMDRIIGTHDNYSINNITWMATDKSRDELPEEIPHTPDAYSHFWALPMPNMYTSGVMCTGSNVLPRKVGNNWRVLEDLYENVLVRSKFNNDLSVPSLNQRESPSQWFDTLATLVKEDEDATFPYHLLTGF